MVVYTSKLYQIGGIFRQIYTKLVVFSGKFTPKKSVILVYLHQKVVNFGIFTPKKVYN